MRDVVNLNRRQFLIGAAGFTLALPILPSLLRGSRARAQPPVRKRFVAFTSPHGGVWERNMFPASSTAGMRFTIPGGHEMRYGALAPTADTGDTVLSPVLRASSSVLTPQLVSKMNVLRGLSIMFYIGHHQGGHLGNYAAKDESAADLTPQATIDQIMAYSSSFYSDADLGGIRQRSIHVSAGPHASSWGWSDPEGHTGAVEALPSESSQLDLFNRLLASLSMTTMPPPPPPTPRRAVVDRVLDHYRGLTSGRFGDAQRLSASDRRRLDEYMQRLSEVQRRVQAMSGGGTTTRPASCGTLAAPPRLGDLGYGLVDVDAQTRWYEVYNDVIAAAFMCDVSRIAIVNVGRPFATGSNDDSWHDEAHQAHVDPMAQSDMVQSNNNVFRVVADLAAKLDVEEAPGVTILDNSLVQWTQESGLITHHSNEYPVITFGGAGGFFSTGRMLDYRNLTNPHLTTPDNWGRPESADSGTFYIGLTYNQWLSNALQSMGVPTTEFALPRNIGYGADKLDNPDAMLPYMRTMANDALPQIA